MLFFLGLEVTQQIMKFNFSLALTVLAGLSLVGCAQQQLPATPTETAPMEEKAMGMEDKAMGMEDKAMGM